MAINRPQVAVFIGPFVPDAHPMLLEPADVGIAGNEPQKLVDDRFQVHFLGGEEGKAVLQVEAHLVAEHTLRTGARAVFLEDAVCTDVPEEV